jgi:hypothetical protein
VEGFQKNLSWIDCWDHTWIVCEGGLRGRIPQSKHVDDKGSQSADCFATSGLRRSPITGIPSNMLTLAQQDKQLTLSSSQVCRILLKLSTPFKCPRHQA